MKLGNLNNLVDIKRGRRDFSHLNCLMWNFLLTRKILGGGGGRSPRHSLNPPVHKTHPLTIYLTHTSSYPLLVRGTLVAQAYHLQPENNILDFVKIRSAVGLLTCNSHTDSYYCRIVGCEHINHDTNFQRDHNPFVLYFHKYIFSEMVGPPPYNKVGSFIL